MMRIAFFTDTYEPQVNGVVSAVRTLSEELARSNRVFLFYPGERLRVGRRKKGVRMFEIPSLPFPFYESYRVARPRLLTIHQLFDEVDADLVHVHTPATLGLIGASLARVHSVPCVATYHTLLPEYFPHLTFGKARELMRTLGRLSTKPYTQAFYNRVDATIAPSKEIANLLGEWKINNVRVIPNPIDKKFFRKRTPKVKARRIFGLPSDAFIFLYLGRLSLEKRVELLLRAFKIVERKLPNAFLAIAGSGPDAERLRRLKERLALKRVKFLGFIDPNLLEACYRAADVFVSPSPSETQGLTFVEAMACGLALIGANTLGAREVIRENDAGILVRPNSVRSLAKAMLELGRKPKLAERLGERNAERARRYHPSLVAEKHMLLYSSLSPKAPSTMGRIFWKLIHTI